LQFDFAVIEAATNKFSNENFIGKGGFGEVYKVGNCGKIYFLALNFFINNGIIYLGHTFGWTTNSSKKTLKKFYARSKRVQE
jgi:hypothetical protein